MTSIQVSQKARDLLKSGMAEAVRADGFKQKADKATAGATTTLTEAAIECGSAEAWDMLTASYYIEVRNNVGGAADAIKAVKGKGGEYLIPPVARTVISELSKAFKLRTSLFEPETDKDGNETDIPSDKPRSYSKVRAANKIAKDHAEAVALEMGNPALAAFLKRCDTLALVVEDFKSNAALMIVGEGAEVARVEAATSEFSEAVAALSALRVAIERAKAEADKAEAEAEKAAGDTIAEAEAATEAEAAPTPRKGRARK